MSMILGLLIMAYGLVSCFYGYKIFKFELAAMGFIIGGSIGGLLGALLTNQAFGAILIGLIFGSLNAYISFKIYKIGIFLFYVSATSLVSFIILEIMAKFDFSIQTLIGIAGVSIIIGIVLATFLVKLDELFIKISTGICGAFLASAGLALMIGDQALTIIIVGSIVLSVLGMMFQIRSDKKTSSDTINLPMHTEVNPSVEVRSNTITTEPVEKNVSILEKAKTSVNNGLNYIKLGNENNSNPGQKILVENRGCYWTTGMPMLVTDIQIVSNIENTSEVLLNIEVQNLNNTEIVGFYIDIECYDLLKNKLESITNHDIIDLKIAKGQKWFTNKSILLPNSSTRKCVITVKNIVFLDEQIWNNPDDSVLVNLENNENINIGTDLMDEYYTEINEYMNIKRANGVYLYIPKQHENYWNCSCGQININNQCVRCNIDKDFILSTYNSEQLAEKRQKRIKEQKQLQEERKAQEILRKEEMKRNAIATVSSVKNKSLEIQKNSTAFIKSHKKLVAIIGCVLIIAIVLILICISINNRTDNRYFRSLNSSDYKSACDIFNGATSEEKEKIRNKVDSDLDNILNKYAKDKITLEKAEELANKYDGNYILFINNIDNFKKDLKTVSDDKENDLKGIQYMTDGKYKDAIDSFKQVSDINKFLYDKAQKNLNNAYKNYKKNFIAEIQELIDQERYSEASQKIINNKDYFDGDKEIETLYQSVNLLVE